MMVDLLRFDGKHVVVTGAASGIGQATATLLTELGAEVFAADRNELTVDGAAYVAIDLSDPASIERAVDGLPGRIDALFNCAGISTSMGPLEIMRCNFSGTRLLTERVIPRMPPGSAIATVSSVAGREWHKSVSDLLALLGTTTFDEAVRWCEAHPEVIDTGYVFSKRSITLYSILTAARLIPAGIRMNVLSPGATATAMWASFNERVPAPVIRDAITGMGRPADPAEQARALAFIASDAATFLTGSDLINDGGKGAADLAASLMGAPV